MDLKIPIILCIDVEPDGFFIDRSKTLPWRGYEKAFEYVKELRPRLEAATGSPVHFSWFHRLDPQVDATYGSPDWAVTHYAEYAETLLKEGDEMGLHPHAYRWIEKKGDWIVDHQDQTWVDHCVRVGFETFERVFNKTCISFRFGASWLNNPTLKLAEKLGARFDLTLEPQYVHNPQYTGYKRYVGSYLNYDNVPKFPYRPSKSDMRIPDPARRQGIWMIPVSAGQIVYRHGRTERFLKSIFRPWELKPQPVTLNPAFGANRFKIVVEDLLESLERPYFVFAVRSDSFATPVTRKNIEACFDYLLKHPLSDQFVVATPEEAMKIMGYLRPSPRRRVFSRRLVQGRSFQEVNDGTGN